MIANLVKKLASQVPEHGTGTYIAQGVGALAIAAPVIGMVLPQSGLWLPEHFVHGAELGLSLATVGLESMIVSKLATKHQWWVAKKPQKRLEIMLGGMVFEEKALFTNMLAFGSIGSGKTAAVIYPVLDSVMGLYNDEDVKSPTAKCGGFVLDVKGDFHEAVIYLMQKHGRDVLKDLVVIRPDNDYFMIEFEEVNSGDHFFVAATGGILVQECDKVLSQAEGPDSVMSVDDSGFKRLIMPNGDLEKINSFMFTDRTNNFLRDEMQVALAQLTFNVEKESVRWLGWREEGGRLVRVRNTVSKITQYELDKNGDRIFASKPKKLRYVGVSSLNNGLTYNLISKTAASTEAAGRIMAVAEVTGNSMGGDNAYWKNASEKHIAACVELFRQVEGPMGRECSVNDIQKFTTNDVYLQGYVGKLKGVIKDKQLKGVSEYEILLLRNLDDYFTGEWLKHDPKTKGNIMSCVTNLFGDVTRNQQLIKTFCQPSRFSFEDCLNDGKIYTLVLSAYPNAQMLIGTCMKLDFQQVVLKRTQAAPVNKNRFLMFVADEYQYFITTSGTGSTGGDDKFLSVARQSRIFNLVCTQAKTSLLAVQKDEFKIDAFIQCFGSRVFLQNLDEKTNKLAEQTFGQFWAERVDFSGPDLKFSSAFGGEGKHGSISRRQEKQNRYEASAFTQFPPFKAVLFNKERPPGRKIIEADLKETAKFWNKDMLADAANGYYQAYLENRATELGVNHIFETRDNFKPDSVVEKEQRAKGILRSWRGGKPYGSTYVPGKDETATSGNSDEVNGEGDPEFVNNEEAGDVGIEKELGAYPPFEDLKGYNNKPIPFYSDLEASQSSDPFFSRTDDKIVATPPEGEAKPVPNLAEKVPTQEDSIVKDLESIAKPKQNRILANLNNITQEVNSEGHAEETILWTPKEPTDSTPDNPPKT